MTSSMTLEEVVFSSQKFRDALEAARELMVRSEFPAVEWDREPPAIDWGFALLYASAITSVQSERAQSAVLRIATACILASDAEEAHKAAAAALLERCGNHMAVEIDFHPRLGNVCLLRSGWKSFGAVSTIQCVFPGTDCWPSIHFRASFGKQ